MVSIGTQKDLRQPDIYYTPDLDKYQARQKARLQIEAVKHASLPPAFPQRLISDLAWEGDRLADTYDWTYVLNGNEVQELEDALVHFRCTEPTVDKKSFF